MEKKKIHMQMDNNHKGMQWSQCSQPFKTKKIKKESVKNEKNTYITYIHTFSVRLNYIAKSIETHTNFNGFKSPEK